MIQIDLKGKTAFVTGATGQLGRVIVRKLCEAGANVALQYQHNGEKAAQLVEEARGLGVQAMAVQGDITVLSQVEEMGRQVRDKMGWPHILVTAAVIQYTPWVPVIEQSLADYESQFQSCVLHNVHVAKVFLPGMEERGEGRYIGINTELSKLYRANQSAYASAKSGMDTLLKILAKEEGPKGITVNQVSPGWMISDRAREQQVEDAAYAKELPLGHRGTDEDIANAVVFLASPMAKFITGVNLPVSGGSVLV